MQNKKIVDKEYKNKNKNKAARYYIQQSKLPNLKMIRQDTIRKKHFFP